MLEYGLRFLAGGIAVSAFAALGDTLRPKSFAGLFGAAPSIALATLLLTLSQKGAPFVALEGRSMILELWPKVGEGVNRGRRHIVGVFEPPLLHRRSDMPCPTIPLSN